MSKKVELSAEERAQLVLRLLRKEEPTPAFISVRLRHPVPNRLRRRLKLPR